MEMDKCIDLKTLGQLSQVVLLCLTKKKKKKQLNTSYGLLSAPCILFSAVSARQ